MRRLFTISGVLVLLLALASPVAAARPITESGMYESASAYASSCEQQGGNTVCTDTSVDVFTGPGWSDACVSVSSYSISPSGRYRSLSNAWGCAPATAFSLADDLSSASLGATDVQLYSCGRITCTEGDVVSVAADWTAAGEVTSYSGRSSFTDGTCTYRSTFEGASAEASASISLDGSHADGWGSLFREAYTVTVRCR